MIKSINPSLTYIKEFKLLFIWNYSAISTFNPHVLTSKWLLLKHQSMIQKNFQGIWWQLQTYFLLFKKLTPIQHNVLLINLETSYQSFRFNKYQILQTFTYLPSTKLSNLFYSLINYVKLFLGFPTIAIIIDSHDNKLIRLFHNLLVVTINLTNYDQGDYNLDLTLSNFLTQILLLKYLLRLYYKK